jgi:hypothetical protein
MTDTAFMVLTSCCWITIGTTLTRRRSGVQSAWSPSTPSTGARGWASDFLGHCSPNHPGVPSLGTIGLNYLLDVRCALPDTRWGFRAKGLLGQCLPHHFRP